MDKKALDEHPTLLRRKPRAIISPYKNDKEALVIFDSKEGKTLGR